MENIIENEFGEKTLSFKAKVDEKREFTAIISDDSIDRDKEVLLPSGMNKKDYEKNGVILFNHNQDLPIGVTTALRRSGNGWKATGRIAEGVQAAEDVWQLIKQGVLKGVSVGFKILERRLPSKEDQKMFGKDVESVISKWQLLEFSIVSVPCNQNALISGCKALDIDPKNILGEDFVEEVIEEVENIEKEDIVEEVRIEDMKAEIEEEIKSIDSEIEIEEEIKEKLIEVSIEKKVDLKLVVSCFVKELQDELKRSKGRLF